MKMEFRAGLLLIFVHALCLVVVLCDNEKKCNPRSLKESPCPFNETCLPEGYCMCMAGFQRDSTGSCFLIPTTQAPSTVIAATTTTETPSHAEKIHQNTVSMGTVTAAVLVPLILIAGGVLVLVGRRYRWFERLQALRGRRYEEVRIGHEDDEDDDPPLA